MAKGSVDTLTRDLRAALRRLRRAPGLSTLVVLSLALGIGANTAIFSVARSVLFEPVPYPDPDRVVLVDLYSRELRISMSARQAAVVQRLARSLERVEAISFERIDWRRGDSTARLRGRFVTPELPSAMEMTLATVGVFGVTSYAAGQRRREIGIRLAVGAQARDVERLVVLQGLVPSLAGIVAGLAGAFALARVMGKLVHGVSVTDPTIYVSTALTLAAVSLIATWVPARRASRVDPILVLRNE